MASGNSTDIHPCVFATVGTVQIMFFAMLPLHAVLIKIFVIDFKFNLPRHTILCSISLSDAVLVSSLFISGLVSKIVTITTQSSGCLVYRAVAIFISCSTLVISSMSITAMNMERYLACIHSFRLHQILTKQRVRYGSIFVWMLGCIIGIVAVITTNNNNMVDIVILSRTSSVHYIYIVFVIPPSVSIAFMQVQLFMFVRRAINRVIPARASSAELELASHRKKQMKIAFTTSIISVTFLLCMLPLALAFLYQILGGEPVQHSVRSILIGLSFCNSLVDPFIYGFGIAHIRRSIFRNLKEIKKMFSEMC